MFGLLFFSLLLLIFLFTGALVCEAWLYSGEQQATLNERDRHVKKKSAI